MMNHVISKTFLILNCSFLICLYSCSVSKQISQKANTILLNDTAIRTGHVGISIYEPSTGKYWYNYNATKYFIPASNTKLFTLYAGMKYLGDSLVGIRYSLNTIDSSIIIQPSGDPTFLHPDFRNQPVFDFLKKRNCAQTGIVDEFNFRSQALGRGWAWDDFGETYMSERSAFPINGNVVSFFLKGDTLNAFPGLFYQQNYSSIASWNRNQPAWGKSFKIYRRKNENFFQTVSAGKNTLASETTIPFITSDNKLITEILENIIGCKLTQHSFLDGYYRFPNIIHSQPSDSLFKPMMYRSDNFFAEQTLLMASNEHLGYMSDEAIIDTLLKSGLKDVPQRPKWVDGSGLSRYNLFTPQSFVYILGKMKDEFGWDRVKNILPTGGTGTLASYYKKENGFIYAKTGTLSNNCALSGYMITKKGKFLIFSVLANNYSTGATPVRKAVEQFLVGIREKY